MLYSAHREGSLLAPPGWFGDSDKSKWSDHGALIPASSSNGGSPRNHMAGTQWQVFGATASSRELSATPQVVSEANALDDWSFPEWLHGRTLEPCGMAGQSWNAGAFLLARHAIAHRAPALLPPVDV